MAYSEAAREQRRCQARRSGDGEACCSYAVWGDPLRRCAAHGGRVPGWHQVEKTAATPCRCAAYPYPHRPGGGLCRWPDVPRYELKRRPGIHADEYKRLRRFFGRAPNLAIWWQIRRRQQVLGRWRDTHSVYPAGADNRSE